MCKAECSKRSSLCSSKKFGVSSVNALLVLALSPFGGSLVTLTLFCNTVTGKCLAGMELRKRRKSSWMSSGSSARLLMTSSMVSIQDCAK